MKPLCAKLSRSCQQHRRIRTAAQKQAFGQEELHQFKTDAWHFAFPITSGSQIPSSRIEHIHLGSAVAFVPEFMSAQHLLFQAIAARQIQCVLDEVVHHAPGSAARRLCISEELLVTLTQALASL